ncbi:cocE, partial [Symbiodinium microadriaticum]
EFPAHTPTKFYLHSDGSASTITPSGETTESTGYVYDPTDPVPTVGGNNLDMPCGPLDQAEIDKRSDVLVFETEALIEALPLTGPLSATLYVSSDAIDTDFMARLIQDSAIRMRWREGGLTPVYMEAGEVYEVHGNLWNTSYVLAPGHKLRLVVTSSPFITANNVLYHSERYPSHFTLPVVAMSKLPELHDIKGQFNRAFPRLDADEVLRGKSCVAVM